MNIKWVWRTFDRLSNSQVYDILLLRQQVFVLEQKCLYLDTDGRDQKALHLFGCSVSNNSEPAEIMAYARLLPPCTRYVEPSIGRVLVVESARRHGLGKQLIQRCLEKCEAIYPKSAIKISAQVYLVGFYQSFGFKAVGKPYDDGGISHIGMIRDAHQ